MESNGNFHWMKHPIPMSKVPEAAHINDILKVFFLFVDSGITLQCLTQNICWEKSHPWRWAVLPALRMDPHWDLGLGLFQSSLIFLEWTHLTAGLGERENEKVLIYLLIHWQEGKRANCEKILLGWFGTVVQGKREQLPVHGLGCDFGSLPAQLSRPHSKNKPQDL